MNARVSLAVEPGGRVILAAAMGSEGDYKDKLILWACDRDCGVAQSWSNGREFAPEKLVPKSVAAVVDGKGGIGLAVAGQEPYGLAALHLYVCAQDCLSDTAVWSGGLIDSGEALNASDPVPPIVNCTTMGWEFFNDVTAAFQSGKVRMAVGAVHAQGGWARECTNSGDCIGQAQCIAGKCGNEDCSFQTDIYMDRLYLIPN